MIDFSIVRRPNLELNTQPSRHEWRKLGLDMRRMIIDRTLRGIDINGKKFAEYSPKYREYREKMGKTTDIVNLQDRSEMLNSLNSKEDASGVEIFYPERQRGLVALRHQNGDGVPQREHFGFTSKQVEQINNTIMGYIKKAARL